MFMNFDQVKEQGHYNFGALINDYLKKIYN